MKAEAEKAFVKAKLSKLKTAFRFVIEEPLECRDLYFNHFLQVKTGYDIDVFKTYNQRIDKIVTKGKITSDNQFYEINSIVGQLCQIEPVDKIKIEALNKLLLDYEARKKKKQQL